MPRPCALLLCRCEGFARSNLSSRKRAVFTIKSLSQDSLLRIVCYIFALTTPFKDNKVAFAIAQSKKLKVFAALEIIGFTLKVKFQTISVKH